MEPKKKETIRENSFASEAHFVLSCWKLFCSLILAHSPSFTSESIMSDDHVEDYTHQVSYWDA